MTRRQCVVLCVLLIFTLTGCGGGAANVGGGGGGGGNSPPQNIPALNSIAPSNAAAGTSVVNLVVFGSNFLNGATVNWNGAALPSSLVGTTEITATVPATDLASVGTAKVTVSNPSPGGGTSSAQTFTISAAPTGTTWVRSVPAITTAQNIVWDAVHSSLYVSIPSADTTIPNTVVPINPLTATAGTPVPAGNNPGRLSISSDSAYLWVGADGDNAVERFLLPGLTKDISFTLPLDSFGNPQRAVDLEAARVNPHTVALVSEYSNFETGQGVYIYDDDVRRPSFVPTYTFPGGALIDWIQWGADDSTIYGSQSLTIDQGGVAILNVNPSGVTLGSYNGGQVGPPYSTQYDKNTGHLYSLGYVFNPADGGFLGSFNFPIGQSTCTADSSLGRYFCVVTYSLDGTDVFLFELWVFDLNSYALIDRDYLGATAAQQPSLVTGVPQQLVRWGNAGLALTTNTGPFLGSGGLFLMDGAIVNPKAAPDVPSGSSPFSYSWMASMTPIQAVAGSADVTVTVEGTNFTQDSTACWQCNFLQFRFLPTSYVNSHQLNVTIPASMMVSPAQLPISIFDSNANLFSSDSLTFTVAPISASTTTQMKALSLAGLDLAWDSNSGLLYVGTSEFDGLYPNSIVAVDGSTASIVKTQIAGPDPDFLSVSANGQYLYAAFGGATLMTQFQLPALDSPLTWTLHNSESSAVYWAGAMKAAPESPHTTAVVLLNLESEPDATGGVAVFDDDVGRPNFIPGWGTTTVVEDTLAWGSSDQVLTGALQSGFNGGPLSDFQINASGAILVANGTAPFNTGEIHSDFATGLVYSDDGNVADPATQSVVGTYNASGILVPDSLINRVFILGQTASQAGTSNFTIQSFDEKAYTHISSITLPSLLGTPIELVRWGASGLAVLTANQDVGSPGMLYLIQDTSFVSNAQSIAMRFSSPQELVKRRWKRFSKADMVRMLEAKRAAMVRPHL
jgi:hypothetical protein